MSIHLNALTLQGNLHGNRINVAAEVFCHRRARLAASSGDSVNGEADSFLVGKPPRMASSSLFSPKDPGRAFQVQKVRQESPKVGR